MNNMSKEIDIQKSYYTETANLYNEMHVNEQGEHFFALSFLVSMLDCFQIKSILDIGSGTGRAVLHIKKLRPDIKIVGIEPIQELRKIGYQNGLSEEELTYGDATNLNIPSQKYDLVCEFGVLHHIKKPELAVAEMLRISKKAIFISDSNNFGEGSLISRSTKQLLNLLGLWDFADLLKTKGKGYRISEGDGLSYSYSVFNNYQQVKSQCKSIYMLNTKDASVNFYKTASHVALLGIKK